MPELVKLMMENVTGEDCEVFMLAYSNRSLKWHMDEEYFSERFNILRGGFDYCVIQEQAHPLTSMEDTEKYTGRIIEMCANVGVGAPSASYTMIWRGVLERWSSPRMMWVMPMRASSTTVAKL